jgi:hypothetical protein
MDESTLERLAEVADTVATEHESMGAALQDELAQGVALLDAVVTRVKRALPALASRVVQRETTTWHGQETHTEERSFGWRGLLVSGTGAERDHPQDNRGRYEGGGVWLASDGRWYLVTYEGTWSRWQGEGDEWWAGADELTTAQAIERAGSVEVILSAIATALQSHAGKRDKATARAERAAERLAALRTLF